MSSRPSTPERGAHGGTAHAGAPRPHGPRTWAAPLSGSVLLIALLVIVIGSALAFAFASSAVSRPSLPVAIDVGHVVSATPAPPPSTTVPPTTTPPRGSTSLPTTTAPASTTTSSTVTTTAPPSTTQPAKATPIIIKGQEGTTVVKTVPTVSVEDNNGRHVDDENTEATTGTTDHEASGDN